VPDILNVKKIEVGGIRLSKFPYCILSIAASIGYESYWWSATESPPQNVYNVGASVWSMDCFNPHMMGGGEFWHKMSRLSVRCVQD